MKPSYPFIAVPMLLFAACTKNVPEPDNPRVYMRFHNTLHSNVEIVGSPESVSVSPNSFWEYQGTDWFTYDETFSGTAQFRLRFANGLTKTDTKCGFFQTEPPYYSLCMSDSVSVYRSECYTVEISGNDTLYHYSIGLADSLEAH